jgi:hypothetical protein
MSVTPGIRGQLGFLFGRSHCGDHLPALAREQFGGGPAKTGRTAGNEDRLLWVVHFESFPFI